MAASLTTAPKAPKDFDKEMAGLWKDSCARFIDANGVLYKSDLAYIEMYVRSWHRWQEIRKAAETAGLYDERLRLNELFKFEQVLANSVKQNYRAMENTVLERVRVGQAGDGRQGGRVGVRQKPSRDGVPQVGSAKAQSSAGISWLDEARAKKSA